MRVLIASGYPTGGAERVAGWLADQLADRGVDVDRWVPRRDQPWGWALAGWVGNRRLRRYDIVHAHHRAVELAARAAGLPGRTRRFTMHHAPVRARWLLPSTLTSCPSRTVIDTVGRPEVTFIPNPVLNTWRVGPPTGVDLTVGYVGRVEDPQKNWPAWLAVLTTLAGWGVDVRGEVFGDGSGLAGMRTAASHLLPGRVTFHGQVDPDQITVPAGTVLLLTSRWECSPLVAVEAAASGIPVVATPVGDLPETPSAFRLADTVDGLAAAVLTAGRAGPSDPFRTAGARLATDRHPEMIVDRYLAWYTTGR